MRHKTSIIILSYNTLELLQLCVNSIREYTEAGTYEIIVVENASKDGSAEWLREQMDLRCIYNEENQGFPKGCNQGLSIAEGTELLLLNSDVIVTKNWLENLCRALYSAPEVGAVSCVTNCCSNNQQIETSYENVEDMQAFAATYNVSDPARWERKTTLVGFCFLFKREVFDKVGFLDEQFSPGNFEDDDYSLRILQQGWDLLLCHDTFIHHFGHASFSKGYGDQEVAEKVRRSNALLRRNGALFQQKWHIPSTYKIMDVEELRRLLQHPAEAVGTVQESRLPREKKIAVIVRKSSEEWYGCCMESLERMEWPQGYAVEVFTLDAAKPYAAQVNEILTGTDAKVKIYINDEMCLIHPQVIEDLLTIFQDESIGMAGILGSQSLPVNGDLMDSPYKRGAVYVPSKESFSEQRFEGTRGKAEDVRGILPFFFATQRDIPWDESYEKQYYAVLDHCRAMEEAGMRIVVPLPEDIWCVCQLESIFFDNSDVDRKKFFGKYHAYIDRTDAQERSTLYACGEGSEVPSWQRFSRPEGISIGVATQIHETAFLRLSMPNFEGKPRIVLGDHCKIGAGSTLTAMQRIEFGNSVSVAENVHIKDYVYDDSGIGLLPKDCAIVTKEGGIKIERGVRLEENVSIKGAVRIGRGSIVKAGSTVCTDIPAYCIAEGSPARITFAFSPKAGEWLSTERTETLRKVLAERRRTTPLLTIAFITYNRSRYLKKSLRCVLQQVGNDDLVEILVSDNASTDDTRAFVEEMQRTHKNLRYHCNEKNIGAEGNIHEAIKASRGEYVLVMGDDDYFVDGAIHVLLSGIVRYRGIAIFCLGQQSEDPRSVCTGTGRLRYIEVVSYFMGWISCIVMRRELYDHIREPHKYDDSRIPQVYLQMEILKQNPDFAVLIGSFFMESGGDHKPKGYNFIEVFVKNYFDILTASVEIPAAQLSAAKKHVLEHSILPWCKRIKEEQIGLSLDGIFDIIEEYYGNEPYYAQLVELLGKILQD
ncbi:glycosyltransferase [Selenomonas sputigena]|uniref:Glycosyl transferase family 2 n=1 Tax=Selenomonas sputigena (strain ATCC 35185 / DSM 20758 / CCUG 44933 / VPI D19B-28) TaxID=546271 RepID=C9LXD9_SELS3|nr:glycosyltransferase [Selenomonas sputigena]AEB99503.1 glycosyl transferase family 2 [Selenomonas sputigena ATCC 35185]EEX76322.1 glycosyltransferase, group 2 family protein [Selenomonas sputigena ATCC 35185]